jgi:hypothetical protein
VPVSMVNGQMVTCCGSQAQSGSRGTESKTNGVGGGVTQCRRCRKELTDAPGSITNYMGIRTEEDGAKLNIIAGRKHAQFPTNLTFSLLRLAVR